MSWLDEAAILKSSDRGKLVARSRAARTFPNRRDVVRLFHARQLTFLDEFRRTFTGNDRGNAHGELSTFDVRDRAEIRSTIAG